MQPTQHTFTLLLFAQLSADILQVQQKQRVRSPPPKSEEYILHTPQGARQGTSQINDVSAYSQSNAHTTHNTHARTHAHTHNTQHTRTHARTHL